MQIVSHIATYADLIAACALLCRDSTAVQQAVAGCSPVEAERVTDRLAAARPGTPPDWFARDPSLGRFVAVLDDDHILAWTNFGAGTQSDLVAWYNSYSGHVLWSPPHDI
jgi:hypothetical protein